jgi:hypothetical protein
MICMALEQFELYAPEVIDSFKKLVATGHVEILAETYYHSLAFVHSKEEFKEQDFMDAIQTMGHAFNNDLYHLHIYVGVYEITDRNEEVSIMCDKANLAIKTLGENYDKSIAYYSDTIFHDTVAEKQLVGDFDKALAEKQFCMYLQPQVNRDGADTKMPAPDYTSSYPAHSPQPFPAPLALAAPDEGTYNTAKPHKAQKPHSDEYPDNAAIIRKQTHNPSFLSGA